MFINCYDENGELTGQPISMNMMAASANDGLRGLTADQSKYQQ